MDGFPPLDGIKVLDLTQAMAGPIATMLIGDLGAEIIKIEPPGGDQTRAWAPPFIQNISAYFLSVNRNKGSLVLDLKKPEGLSVLKRLISDADILIENFRPGTMEKLGISKDIALNINPKLIFCSLSGYGQTGPQKNWAGYDLTVLATSGLLSMNAEEGRIPIKFGVPIADIVSGLFADVAILSALYERSISGKGQYIDMSMFDSNFLILTHQAFSYFATSRNPKKLGSAHSTISPYQVFRTKDSFIALAVGTEKLWKDFCACIGREDLLTDQRYLSNRERVQNRDSLVQELEETLSKRNTQDLFESFLQAGIPAAPINSVGEALASEQAKARDMVTSMEAPYGKIPMLGTPFKLSRTPGSLRKAPPKLGADTMQILKDAGYTQEEILNLKKSGAINGGEWPPPADQA